VTPPPSGSDYDRRLSGRGKRDADALGARLGVGGDRLGLGDADVPELVLCSSARRTRQTADRMTAAMQPPPDLLVTGRLYGSGIDAILTELEGVGDDIGSVMVVGHNPGIHQVVWRLLTSGDDASRTAVRAFAPGSLAVFDLGIHAWGDALAGNLRLEGFFTPPYESPR
jgi:phosphohistidine phosphatase